MIQALCLLACFCLLSLWRNEIGRAAASALIFLARKWCGPERTRYIARPGEPNYMTRYAIWGWLPKDGPPSWLRRRLPNIYLHHIQRPDHEDLHNHPWHLAVSLILRGSYVEERCHTNRPFFLARTSRCLTAGSFNVLRYGTDFHRIKYVSPGGVWTLFITSGRHSKGWGFIVPGEGFVPNTVYEAARK